MKLSPDQYDWSKKLKRVKVKDPTVAKALARIADGEKHVVLRTEGGPEVVAMSLEEYESLMETIDVLSDDQLMQALKESEEDIRAGRLLTHEQVFGHPLPEPPEPKGST